MVRALAGGEKHRMTDEEIMQLAAGHLHIESHKPFGVPVGMSGTDQKFKYAGEMLAGAAGTSPGLHCIFTKYTEHIVEKRGKEVFELALFCRT